jgi:hypothetical protein
MRSSRSSAAHAVGALGCLPDGEVGDRRNWTEYTTSRDLTRQGASGPGASRRRDQLARLTTERRATNVAAREATATELACELARLRARVESIERELPADAHATGVYS